MDWLTFILEYIFIEIIAFGRRHNTYVRMKGDTFHFLLDSANKRGDNSDTKHKFVREVSSGQLLQRNFRETKILCLSESDSVKSIVLRRS